MVWTDEKLFLVEHRYIHTTKLQRSCIVEVLGGRAFFVLGQLVKVFLQKRIPITEIPKKRPNSLLIFKIYVFSDFKTQKKVLTGVFMSVTNKLLNWDYFFFNNDQY